MFDPIQASQNIKDEFISYITTSFNIADPDYSEQFRKALQKEGAVTKGPFLEISDSFKKGASLAALIKEGVISDLFNELEGDLPDGEKEIQLNRGLYLHQEQAIRKANQGKNLIVTTGTGSGKTECFLIPIIHHLLHEIEDGELDSGVRAILIYPMNALANDQMKRLRKLFRYYPKITFGVYNSSTKEKEEQGRIGYGKIFKDATGKPMTPLKNEVISRDQMRATPPHILITNYAMLEYMMLRPKDDLVFSGAKLRFLVLDEAHIYRGATGMETAMLLKRLKARISNPDNVLHILTSATLGKKDVNPEIVKFAETLCDAKFRATDIIRSERIPPDFSDAPLDIPAKLFADLSDPNKPLNNIVADYGLAIPEGQADTEYLYDLCTRATLYRELRKILTEPMTIPEITKALQKDHEITDQDVIHIIHIAAQAVKNMTPLIKARYHLFAKAPEGMYITLDSSKKLMLTRNSTIKLQGEDRKVFECAVCDDCGRVAIVGKSFQDKIEFGSGMFDQDISFYLIRDPKDSDLDEYDEEDEADGKSQSDSIEIEDYLICAACGSICDESLRGRKPCDCGKNQYIQVRKAKPSSGTNHSPKCPVCKQGSLKMFYLGQEAATSVLGTSLFEELPESEKRLKSEIDEARPAKSGLFGAANRTQPVERIQRAKQFLTFSDSRGEAAFFASYMQASYGEFLRRRGIWHVVEKNRRNMANHPWEIQDFVEELTAYFDSCRTFADPGDDGSSNLTAISRKHAWIAVLNEMVNARRSTSLVSLGLIKFNYKGNSQDMIQNAARELGQKAEDTQALFDLLVMDIVYHGALEGGCELTDSDRDYIFYSTRPKRFKKLKDRDQDTKKTHLRGWACAIRDNGSLISNSRLKRVMKALDKNEAAANELLKDYWNGVLCGTEGLSSADNQEFYIHTNRFTIQAGTEATPLFRCDTCGKVTMHNCKNFCQNVRCGGRLQPISREAILAEDHYAKLYQSEEMKPLHIKEHTAQLGREQQQKYQEMFINKKINALSCSTTFEMGVDVGDLETVFLRNMPPSPANYVQRAGRAGRGLNTASFSLTYAKLSSHDYTFYSQPTNMITGKIGVPLFAVRNEKIILRHIFAVALSAFFAKNPDVYNLNDADVFLNGDGWEKFREYLAGKPADLKRVLLRSIPENMHAPMGLADYAWTERLIGADGVLKIAVEDYRKTIEFYEAEVDRFFKEGNVQKAAAIENKLKSFRRGKEDQRGRNELIEFLVRNNVLPKYGFPVDTVELHQNANAQSDRKLQMVRDLQLAVSEYAPDSQVVADGKLYTSRYIRKLPLKTGQDWEIAYIAQCKNSACMTWNYRTIQPNENEELFCIACHEPISRGQWQQAIEPRKGFIASANPTDVPMRKPEKAYRSEDCYIGDTQRQVIEQFKFILKNGNQVQLETSVNDSLMVVCTDDFYVCSHCGYAESLSEQKKKENSNSHKKTLEKKHSTPWDTKCENKLFKNKLIHVFRTDVVRIIFDHPQAGDYSVMVSAMYALLEALSATLDIERNDIKACLQKIHSGKNLIYAIVLYDAVAGGAGHVRRIATSDGAVFRRVIKKAIKITTECTCSPSCYNCLRNYYNQKIHDILNREYAADFLKKYDDAIEATESHEKDGASS